MLSHTSVGYSHYDDYGRYITIVDGPNDFVGPYHDKEEFDSLVLSTSPSIEVFLDGKNSILGYHSRYIQEISTGKVSKQVLIDRFGEAIWVSVPENSEVRSIS